MAHNRISRETKRNWFLLSATIILAITGIAKVISSMGSADILAITDPVFGIRFRVFFLLTGLLELGLVGFLMFSTRRVLSAAILAWTASGFLVYRIVVWSYGSRTYCSCLGDLTERLHIKSQIADRVMLALLAYLLIGSYVVLFSSARSEASPYWNDVE